MNLRQREFVRAYLSNGGNGTAAAIAAGYSPKGADVQAARLLGNARIQTEIHRALSREGLADELLFGVLLEGLRATRRGEPDHHARARYLDMAFKLRGDYDGPIQREPRVIFQVLLRGRDGEERELPPPPGRVLQLPGYEVHLRRAPESPADGEADAEG